MRYDQVRHDRHDDGVDSELYLPHLFHLLKHGSHLGAADDVDDSADFFHIESARVRLSVDFVFQHGFRV